MDLEDLFEEVAFRILRIFRRLHLTRLVQIGPTRRFADYFKGFENVKAVRGIFGEDTERVLRNLKVEFMGFGYMGVDNNTGHLLANPRYLKNGDRIDIYLDIVHELCHIKQWLDGKELFDTNYSYVDRPTEIEAYLYTVQEAKRLRLSDQRILEYLKTEWITNSELQRLAKATGIPIHINSAS